MSDYEMWEDAMDTMMPCWYIDNADQQTLREAMWLLVNKSGCSDNKQAVRLLKDRTGKQMFAAVRAWVL